MAVARRLTFTLTPETVTNVSAISKRLGISRSGFVENVLSVACQDMVKILDQMPTPSDGFSEPEAKRLRGESISVLQSRVDELRGHIDDL